MLLHTKPVINKGKKTAAAKSHANVPTTAEVGGGTGHLEDSFLVQMQTTAQSAFKAVVASLLAAVVSHSMEAPDACAVMRERWAIQTAMHIDGRADYLMMHYAQCCLVLSLNVGHSNDRI
jgi:hypothetical protein